jgi:hypothetical protein
MMEVQIVEGVRCFVFKREPVAVVKVSKAKLERERKAITGRGAARRRNAVRRPSECVVTTF